MLLFSLAADAFVIRPIADTVVRQSADMAAKAGIGVPEVKLLLYCGKTALRVINVLVIGVFFYFSCRLAAMPMKFGNVLAICWYAAYAQEVARVLITVGVLSYAEFSRVPLTLTTNARVFLDPTTTVRPLYYLAGFVDAPTVAFLVLVVIGLWRSSPNMRLEKAIPIVFTSWLAFIGLGYCWRH